MPAAPVLQPPLLNLRIEGQGEHAVVMLHGWPDTLALWDGTVAALSPHLRCARFTLPGYDAADPPRAVSLAEVVDLLAQAVDRISPDRPVALMLHDWGCFFGYHYARLHPQRVARIVGIDVGDAGSRAHRRDIGWRGALMVAAYQWPLALAWRIGGWWGDRIAMRTAQAVRCPEPRAAVARMGYPYWITWTATHGSYHAARPYRFDPPCPMFYAYGRRKPLHFHSRAWAEGLTARGDCRVQAFDCGHWVMRSRAAEFHAAVLDWLEPWLRAPSQPV